jgi:hypothetical protein
VEVKGGTLRRSSRERLLACRRYVEQFKQASDLESAVNDRCGPELQAKRVSLALGFSVSVDNRVQQARVNELRFGEVGDDEVVPLDQGSEQLPDGISGREVVFPDEGDDCGSRIELFDLDVVEYWYHRHPS